MQGVLDAGVCLPLGGWGVRGCDMLTPIAVGVGVEVRGMGNGGGPFEVGVDGAVRG